MASFGQKIALVVWQCRLRCLLLIVFSIGAGPSLTLGQWSDSFETPETSWWLLQPSPGNELRKSQRLFQNAIDDLGYEQFQMRLSGEQPARLAVRVDPIVVIDELTIVMWVKSSRPGAKIGAQITLPHTLDPKTGERVTMYVTGDSVTEINRWTKVTLKNIATKLDSELPTLRRVLSVKIDPAEAYIHRVIVEEAEGPGEVVIGVDGLTIDGIVFAEDQPKRERQRAADLAAPPGTKEASAKTTLHPPQVQISAGIVEVNGKPIFLRAIESTGEPLEFLHSLGFNAVKLNRPPTPQLDREAAKLGLWLIAPPLFDPEIRQKQPVFSTVVIWDMGEDVGERELDPARKYIAECRAHQTQGKTAFLATPSASHWEWSRLADLVCIDKQAVFANTELSQFGNALGGEIAQYRPGTPIYCSIYTEPSTALQSQWQASLPGSVPNVVVAPQQLRLQAYHAVLAGARGLLFKSNHRLDGKNSSAELRAASLKWLNLQLDLLAPWAATADALIIVSETDQPLIGALTADRASLLVLLNQSPQAQFEPSGSWSAKTNLPLGSQQERIPRFQITPRGVRQLGISASRQSAKLTVERTSDVDYVIFSEDDEAIRLASEQSKQRSGELAAAQLLLANLWLVHSQSNLASIAAGNDPFVSTTAKLAESAKLLERRDEFRSLQLSEEVIRQTAALRHAQWRAMTEKLPSPVVSPLCVSADLLQAHSELAASLTQRPWSANRLPAGAMESIEALQDAGWLAYQTRVGGFQTRVENSSRSPHQGNGSVSLVATPTEKAAEFSQVTAAITSAGIPVQKGDLVRYQCWVRATEESGSPKGRLQAFDNLGGRSLALEIEVTPEWSPVILYRFATLDTEAKLTLALLGAGGVDLDSVDIQVMRQTESPRQTESVGQKPK